MDDDGMLRSGVLIRHLILPTHGENSGRVIDWIAQNYRADDVWFSLMSQYTPMGDLRQFPELMRPVSPEPDAEIYGYLMHSAIESGYYQDLDAGPGDLAPEFDNTGI